MYINFICDNLKEFLQKLRVILWGEAAVNAVNKEKLKNLPAASPQQTKKRIKRLSSLNEDKEPEGKSYIYIYNVKF